MLPLLVFFIAIIASYIGAFIPWVSSSLTISTLMLLGIPPQIAKSTFQVWGVGIALGWLRALMKNQKIHTEHILSFLIIAFISWILWGSILVTLPTDILVKLTGFFMIAFLLVNLYQKELWIISRDITRRRKWLGYGSYFFLNMFGSVFPMGIGVVYQFFYTYVFRMTILESKIIGKFTYIPFILGIIIPVYISWFFDVSYILAFTIGSYVGSHFGIKHGLHIGNMVLKKILIIWLLIIGLYFLFFA